LRIPNDRPGCGETDVQIPNINCANCLLQVIQFMAEQGLKCRR
jgi:hypothetical protein